MSHCNLCQVIVALKLGEWTELYRTARENDLSSNISKCPHLPFHHKWRSKAQSQNSIIQKTNSHFIDIRSLLLAPRASLVAKLVKNPPATRESWVQSLGWKVPGRRERLPTPVFWPREFHGLYSPWGHTEFLERRQGHILGSAVTRTKRDSQLTEAPS